MIHRSKLVPKSHEGLSIQKLGDKDVKAVLDKCHNLLRDNGYEYWLSAGTLLGLYRENRFLPYDTDIDIEIEFKRDFYDEKNHDDYLKIIELFESAGMKIGRTMVYDKINPMQSAFMCDEQIIFDIYYYYTYKHYLININEWGILKFNKNTIGTPKLHEFKDIGKYYIPEQQEKYLEMRFGERWRTPVQGEKGSCIERWKDSKIDWVTI